MLGFRRQKISEIVGARSYTNAKIFFSFFKIDSFIAIINFLFFGTLSTPFFDILTFSAFFFCGEVYKSETHKDSHKHPVD